MSRRQDSEKQDLGPGARKIELERRLDANQNKMDQARSAGGKPSRDGVDPNEAIREALDKSRY